LNIVDLIFNRGPKIKQVTHKTENAGKQFVPANHYWHFLVLLFLLLIPIHAQKLDPHQF
jgi:hypothetical protein